MSVRRRWTEMCAGLAHRYRGILARDTVTDEEIDDLIEGRGCDHTRRWKPRMGQSVVVVTVCDGAAHSGLGADVIGCQGSVSAVVQDGDHPYEVLVVCSERVCLYGRFSVGELAPLSHARKEPAVFPGRDRSVPPGCTPRLA